MKRLGFIRRFLFASKPPKRFGSSRRINWPYQLSAQLSEKEISDLQTQLKAIEDLSQYGWGHTIDFGRFTKKGILGDEWMKIPACLDDWMWWPSSLDGLSIADVGCYSGGITMIIANRSPKIVYAVDEISEHLMQAKFVCETFNINNVVHINRSLYQLINDIEPETLDIVLLSGVLYHLSDMLLGLYVLRKLLKPGGVLLIESNAVDDEISSYANFGRYHAGMWWQPSSLCIKDMCELMGFGEVQLRFYRKNRCIARTVRTSVKEIPYKRGMNWDFDRLFDSSPRVIDSSIMAPKNREF